MVKYGDGEYTVSSPNTPVSRTRFQSNNGHEKANKRIGLTVTAVEIRAS